MGLVTLGWVGMTGKADELKEINEKNKLINESDEQINETPSLVTIGCVRSVPFRSADLRVQG